MNRFTRLLAGIILASLLSSCAVWTRLDGGRLEGPDGLGVQAPAGWVRFNLAGDGIISMTRDGLPIQNLSVEFRKHDKAFPGIKKSSSVDLLPVEAAELLFADLKSQKALANIRLLDNIPYQVAGKPGFRLHGQYRDDRGASFDLVATGRTTHDGLVVVLYRALSTHYFPRDLKVYEDTLASLQVPN